MSTDAIVMLKEDHKTVNKLFKRMEGLLEDGGEELRAVVEEICGELLVHATIEEEIFYPAARPELEDEKDVLEAKEEHHVVEVLVCELLRMKPSDEAYPAKAIVLRELVKHHVKEEEEEMFPEVREHLGRKELQALGERMMARKEELQKREPRELAEAV